MLNINVTSLGPECVHLLHSLLLHNNGYLLLFSFNNHAEQAASISEINCFRNESSAEQSHFKYMTANKVVCDALYSL